MYPEGPAALEVDEQVLADRPDLSYPGVPEPVRVPPYTAGTAPQTHEGTPADPFPDAVGDAMDGVALWHTDH